MENAATQPSESPVPRPRRPGGWRRNDILVCLAIASAWFLVWPVGNYAITDDWAYVKSLEELHVNGRLRILDWNPMSLVGHLFWGVAFTKLFGFSFTVTKLSVVVMHLIECLMFLRLLALAGVGADLALAAVLALIFNPLHLVHVFTFMTDVPALAWQTIAVYCYLKGLLASSEHGDPSSEVAQRRSIRWLAAGSLAAGWAFLTRQNGILVPAALFLHLVLFERQRLNRRTLLAAFGPAVLIAVLFTYWYQRVHGPTAAYVRSMREVTDFVTHPPLADLPFIAFTLLVYAGWFVIPLAASLPRRACRLPAGKARVAFLCLAITSLTALAFFAFKENKVFPYIINVVTPFGLGMNNEFIIGQRDILWGKEVGFAIAAISLFAALALILRIFAKTTLGRDLSAGNRADTRPLASVDRPTTSGDAPLRPGAGVMKFLLLLLAVELVYSFATAPILFDRHLLLLAPTLITVFCLAANDLGTLKFRCYFACLVPLAAYGVVTTHDLHALSRTACQAGTDLVAAGVDPREILAGYAFDGWMTYDQRNAAVGDHQADPEKTWWRADLWKDQFHEGAPSEADRFVVWPPWGWWKGELSSGTEKKYAVICSRPLVFPDVVPRYQVVRTYPYRNWWPWQENAIYVLRDRGLDMQ